MQLQNGPSVDQSIDGMRAKDADPVIGNFVSRRVTWQDEIWNLSGLAGTDVWVHLVAADASIFSLTFACVALREGATH